MASRFTDWMSSFRFGNTEKKHSISSLISRVQFQRIKHDAKGWRDSITEAENPFYPHRVKQQRIYIDTVLNGHVFACIERRDNLVLLKQYGLYSGDTLDEDQTKLLNTKWFHEALKMLQQRKYYGYTLIELGDMINNEFPDIRLVPRENVSPDRLNVVSIVYAINGVSFNDPENEFYDWTIYAPTPGDKGTSACGYGLLYKIALYEIYLRNLIGANANYNDLYGQPLRHGKTSKLEGTEYDEFCRALDQMGSQAWVVTDLTDEIEFVKEGGSGGNGQGFKTYENFEKRLEAKISKVILGHADALDPTTGKLGSGQDGEESPVAQALEDIETIDARELEYIINNIVIPKLLKIGFPIKPGLVFKFKNDKEKEEIREKKDVSNKATSDFVKQFKEAGFKVELKWLEEHTGIKFTEVEEPAPIDKDIQKKLTNLYGKT